MWSKLSISLGCAASLLISGCASFPRLPDQPVFNEVDVVTNVECELQSALVIIQSQTEGRHWLYDWATSIKIDLSRKNVGSGSAGVGVSIPTYPGNISLGASGTVIQVYESQAGVNFPSYLEDLTQSRCERQGTQSILTGELGVGDWLLRSASMLDMTGNPGEGINFSLLFGVTEGAGASAAFSMFEIGRNLIGGNVGVGHETNATHKVTLTIAPIDPEDLIQARQPGRQIVGDATLGRLRDEAVQVSLERLLQERR